MLTPVKVKERGAKINAVRICVTAVLAAFALVLSYLESLIPLSFVIPLPGIKLGLANIVVMLAFFLLSPVDAAAISLVRIILSAMLFGSPTSFIYSAAGAFAAYAVTAAMYIPFKQKKHCLSFVGLSVICAAFHNLAQLLAASLLLGSAAPMYYLPFLLAAGTVTGFLTGIVANLLSAPIERLCRSMKII